MADASKLIRDGQLLFVFIHLPVPHPPGFYDRNSHQLSARGNYLDNLVLADDTLQQIQLEIAQTPWAADTTLIISSDHSWRIPIWRNQPGWTAEEERVSGGVFDTRPVFVIHFPGQIEGTAITAKESELLEHDIVAAMLDGKVDSPESLNRFLSPAAN